MPTPILINKYCIRVYCGIRDREGVSRAGWVDVDAKNPVELIGVSETPAVDLGRDGRFDDNGVIPCEVIRHDGALLMFYTGFQLVRKVKFLAFTGLARSSDGGATFTRIGDCPVADRRDGSSMINAIHSVREFNGRWRFLSSAGDGWVESHGVHSPTHQVYLAESDSPTAIPVARRVLLPATAEHTRIGRPRLFQTAPDKLELWVTAGGLDGKYGMMKYSSRDGTVWSDPEPIYFDSKQGTTYVDKVLYPSIIETDYGRYMFYNGPKLGETGFFVARES